MLYPEKEVFMKQQPIKVRSGFISGFLKKIFCYIVNMNGYYIRKLIKIYKQVNLKNVVLVQRNQKYVPEFC
jgi:hypothetical protein